MHYEFGRDLEDGKVGEKEIQAFLTRRFGAVLVYENETNSMDTVMYFPEPTLFGADHLMIETKTDFFVSPQRDTGNLFIETESRQKKSGIQVCRADWFLYYLRHFNEVWCIRPSACLALIRTGRFRSVGGGDVGSNTRGVLLEKHWVEKDFLVFTGVTHEC